MVDSAQQILYGGDYNPEQWPRSVWDEDYAAFDLAGITTVTLNVFAWANLEPREGHYHFDRLDQMIDKAETEHRQVILATSTGAMPPWLPLAHPDVLRTDFEGRRHVYGQRHNACPTSPSFRGRSTSLASALAQRYGGRSSLIAWHVSNEYGGACYCPGCQAEFRVWLRLKYASLDALNAAWNTTFWSHTFSDWDQIMAPNALSEHWRGEDHTAFQGITLDYRRFMTDAMLGQFLTEKQAIRAHDPVTPVTTNFMGLYRPIDYFRFSDGLDIASWDNYPPDMDSAARMALTHDLTRGLKNGRPFWVMEQTPSRTASRDVNPVKRPGVMRLWSWQSVAHGADAVLFFQLRASIGACEKYHGAVLDQAGRTDSRVFREVAQLGAEFAALRSRTLGATTKAKVALIWDWDSWWAWEMTDGINRHLKYIDVALSYYRAFWQLGVDLDVVRASADFDRYDIVVAPLLHLIETEIVGRLQQVAQRGGCVVTGMMSGRVTPSDNAIPTVWGSPLAELAGVRVEEIDAAEPGQNVPVRLSQLLSDRAVEPDPANHQDRSTLNPASSRIPPSTELQWEHPATVMEEPVNPVQAEVNGSGQTTDASAKSVAPNPGQLPQPPHPRSDHHASLVMEVLTPVQAEALAWYAGEFYAGTPVVTRRWVNPTTNQPTNPNSDLSASIHHQGNPDLDTPARQGVPCPDCHGPDHHQGDDHHGDPKLDGHWLEPETEQRSSARGDGQVIYIASLLDDQAMSAVIRPLTDHLGLTGPWPNWPDVEVTRRHTDQGLICFVLNHGDRTAQLPADFDCADLLTNQRWTRGQTIDLAAKGVLLLVAA